MPLLNYTTIISVDKTVSQIYTLLISKGAKAILTNYDGKGNIESLSWKVETVHGILPFTLPVNVEACQKVLERQYYARKGPSRAQTTV